MVWLRDVCVPSEAQVMKWAMSTKTRRRRRKSRKPQHDTVAGQQDEHFDNLQDSINSGEYEVEAVRVARAMYLAITQGGETDH